jgi:UDP-N-acetyl-D-mannosaminuronic acid dehydrogenase
MTNITLLGLGYIGLPTAVALANAGYTVSGFDTDPNIAQKLQDPSDAITHHEPELQRALELALASGNFQVTHKPAAAETYVLCVPTPITHDGSVVTPCLKALRSAVSSIINLLKTGDLIIVESTVPVGTCEILEKEIHLARPDIRVHIAYCPERVLPGNILFELKANNRIIGGTSPEASRRAELVYRSFVEGEIRLTDSKTAELCKLAENSFRDVNIAFANELASIADKNDVNPWELIHLANEHPRVNILSPGPGVGGHCIAVDPWFLVSQNPDEARLIKTAREVNSGKPKKVADRVIAFAAEHGARTVACLGLTYKADVTDTRDSPASQITDLLRASGVDVLAVEPNLIEHPNYSLVPLQEALAQADLAVALVKHKAFQNDEALFKWSKPVFDACGLFRTR